MLRANYVSAPLVCKLSDTKLLDPDNFELRSRVGYTKGRVWLYSVQLVNILKVVLDIYTILIFEKDKNLIFHETEPI